MFLNSVGTESGTMKFVMLDTWRIVTSDRYEELPASEWFIAQVNAIANAGKTMPL
jgi:hypothetical protein